MMPNRTGVKDPGIIQVWAFIRARARARARGGHFFVHGRFKREENMANKVANLIHAGKIFAKGGVYKYLFLRKIDPHSFTWFIEEHDGSENETPVSGPNIEEAIRLANRQWKDDYFTSLGCGFRYTLPERDEHGINALFHQMVSSYNSPNGIYFDEELGNNCFVNFASNEARNVWKRLAEYDKAK